EVLSSRWSAVGPVPVGVLAIPVYLLLLVAGLRYSNRLAPWVRGAAALLVFAAIWFIGLQFVWLRAICPWCMFEHCVGLLSAGLAWRLTQSTAVVPTTQPIVGAAGALLVLAVIQAVMPASDTTQRLAADDRSAGVDAANQVSLLQGSLQLDPRDEPQFGSVAAPRTLYLMFDYCCPHCRRTHEYLQAMLAEQPDAFNVVCLPMPRAAGCNPAISETEPRFQYACELAELALAVWQADGTKFSEFDRWLFETTAPRDPDAARAQALRLVSEHQLAASLADGTGAAKIRRNVDAFNASQAEYLPVLLAPGMAPIVGRPESRESLFEMLQRDFLH
ncbi:MAG: thioredoxin domain-containing protein, partial [Planctomycetales bacterium]|nr:thioredoxin domain-containing protein [Planctomycetales bacterium]